jgi:predicted DNA-binding transcriptional regulator AlpA
MAATVSDSRVILAPEGVSAKTQLAVQTLYNWRNTGKGPRSFKLGRLVRYYESDVDEWIASQARASA